MDQTRHEWETYATMVHPTLDVDKITPTGMLFIRTDVNNSVSKKFSMLAAFFASPNLLCTAAAAGLLCLTVSILL